MRKKILKWFLILFVVVFFFSSFTSDAAEDGFDFYPEYWEINGQYYPYYRFESFTCQMNNGQTMAYYFDKPIYGFGFRQNGSIVLNFVCDEPFSYYTKNITTQIQYATNNVPFDSKIGCAYTRLSSSMYANVDIPLFDGSALPSNFVTKFYEYFISDAFVPIYPMTSINPIGVIPNQNFALFNPRASVIDGTLSATWQNGLLNYWPSSYVDMPVLVDLAITNKDTGQKIYTSYPAKSALPDADRITMYDVQDMGLSFSLAKIENLPTNFTLDYITLTPYYRQKVPDKADLVVYKGQSSLILINYDGSFNGVIQVLPDVPLPEPEPEDTSWNIFALLSNFFGNFFNNLGGMIKDLFIPTSEQMSLLWSDANSFFEEKLGFLWYPFDLALDIVDALSRGEAKNEITFPAFSLPINGGIQVWDEMTFPIDQVGIFETVRLISSIVLCSGVAGLAYKKWDEWIGGHNVA